MENQMAAGLKSKPKSTPRDLLDLGAAARRLESLGNATRLEIFQLLVKAGPDGLAVGDIQRALLVPASTLSHHVAHLVREQMVTQVKEGRVLRCRANFTQMNALLRFLTEECCTGVDC
jgi:DNA-binding transcriptional ArsR family regulator